MATDLEYMTSAEIAQTLRTIRLEQAYERASRQAERIYNDERVRLLRVQQLLLEDQNDQLLDQMSNGENDLAKLEDENEDLRLQLNEVDDSLQQAHKDLKLRIREAQSFRAEADALNTANADATKLLSEKLSLARQLSTLKPELDHLKAQMQTQQNALAEKLALQRDLSALQVELETEKRAVHRIKSQEKNTTNDESALHKEIDDLKKELTKAQRDSQKSERESRKKATEWETEKERLEGKLDAFRDRLRSTKEQLKEAETEMERVQASKMAKSAQLTEARMSGANPKKRSVARFDPDMTIGTPGNGGPTKKQKTSLNVGDKSTFSITPFLNRTMSILPEDLENNEEDHDKVDEMINQQIEGLAAESEKDKDLEQGKKPKAATKATRTKSTSSHPLKETTSSKANALVQKPRLEKVTEEEVEKTTETENTNDTTTSTIEPTKKQKLLNKRPNIFDEADNTDVPKTKSLLGPGLRGGPSLGAGKLNLSALGKSRGKLLAEFSPLKKDRRTVAAI